MRSVTIGNEVYVYHNGKLIYKRWKKQGYGVVFDAYGSPFCPKAQDKKRNG